TLCETGAVKYKDDEDVLIFYNPRVVKGEQETYTLEELEVLKNSNDAVLREKQRELMKKLQPLPNVEPTERYSHYVNCGNFMAYGRQSEQMIHMINYLGRQCSRKDIGSAKLIMGAQELFYLDGCSGNGSSEEGYMRDGSCMYGYLRSISEESDMYSEKTKSLEEAVRKAVDSGTLVLAHSEGTTLFSHTVITNGMVLELAEVLNCLAEERRKQAEERRKQAEDRKKLASIEPLTHKIGKLAEKFKILSGKITTKKSFDENDAKNLADGLNELLSMRSKIFKGFTRISGEGLLPKVNSSTEAEQRLFRLMNSFNPGGIILNAIDNVVKNDLIAGLKYIVGRDPKIYNEQPCNSDMRFSVGHDNRVILADCARSYVYNDGVTKANYAIVKKRQLLGGPFIKIPGREYKDIEQIASKAKEVYDRYLTNSTAKAHLAKGATVAAAPRAIDEIATGAEIMPYSAEDYDFELYRKKFLDQYEDEIDIFLKFSKKDERCREINTKEAKKNDLSEILYIIWSSRAIKPKENIGYDEIFFETDLNGSMAAFLNTLCETGAVKYKYGEDALIFYNPEVDEVRGEKETYTLGKLEYFRKNNVIKHAKLMKKLQPLANVVPTVRYFHYINCGNFMGWGKQSEQMIHMINYLNGQCKKSGFWPAKLIMGNHELSYLDGNTDGYTGAGGCCIYGPLYSISEESPMYVEKTKSLEKAVKKAVDSGTLVLAHSEGTTLFSHTVISNYMVTNLAEALTRLARERKDLTSSKPPVHEIDKLAKKFTELSDKIKNNQPFDENDTKNLADRLNEFNSMRPKIFKDFNRVADVQLEINNNVIGIGAMRDLFDIMNNSAYDYEMYQNDLGRITSNSISYIKKVELIPGLKYIVGYNEKINDEEQGYTDMVISEHH
ncbi:MAG: hypothetical protein LBP39_00205, partial [Rickettsiales bacterium]|nr:hypothetical protein [Rickettsiales bacterium]